MTTRRDAKYWIDRLQLAPHPEGGFYRVTYESPESISREALPDRYNGSRRYSSAIYFLIDEESNFSAFHRIASDELWHFYAGDGLTVYVIHPDGTLEEIELGPEGPFQATVPAGSWFGSCVRDGEWALAGCTVAPGFDFADFELAVRDQLSAMYPHHAEWIARLTRH